MIRAENVVCTVITQKFNSLKFEWRYRAGSICIACWDTMPHASCADCMFGTKTVAESHNTAWVRAASHTWDSLHVWFLTKFLVTACSETFYGWQAFASSTFSSLQLELYLSVQNTVTIFFLSLPRQIMSVFPFQEMFSPCFTDSHRSPVQAALELLSPSILVPHPPESASLVSFSYVQGGRGVFLPFWMLLVADYSFGVRQCGTKRETGCRRHADMACRHPRE